MTTGVFSAGRAYAGRITALGWPLLSTVIALVLAAIALTQPIWAFEESDGLGGITRWTYAWTTLNEEEYENGVWAQTTTRSYFAPSFTQYRMRDAVGTTYLVGVFFAVFLLIVVILQYLARSRKVPENALIAVNVIALGLGFAVLGLAALSVSSAASADVRAAVNGFFGTATSGGLSLAWGAGLAWWLWLVATIAALVVFIIPIVRGRPGRPVPVPR